MPLQVRCRPTCPGLKFDVGSETYLAFNCASLEIPNHVDPSEARTLDAGVGAAPYRVIPHVHEFRLETETQIFPNAEVLGNGHILEEFMRAIDERITRRCPSNRVGRNESLVLRRIKSVLISKSLSCDWRNGGYSDRILQLRNRD